jgi:hypothetical protein
LEDLTHSGTSVTEPANECDRNDPAAAKYAAYSQKAYAQVGKPTSRPTANDPRSSIPKISSAVNRGWITCRVPLIKSRAPTAEKTNDHPARKSMFTLCREGATSAVTDAIDETSSSKMKVTEYIARYQVYSTTAAAPMGSFHPAWRTSREKLPKGREMRPRRRTSGVRGPGTYDCPAWSPYSQS